MTMGESDNKRVVRSYVDAFNRGDIETLKSLFTDDALIYGVLGWGGMDVVAPIWQMLHDTFAITLEIDAIAEEGDTVAVRYTERGRSVGEFRGHAPTGRPYEIVAMEWFELKDSRIRRRWAARDSAAEFRQMGLPIE
jgi:predicted ester cyclase